MAMAGAGRSSSLTSGAGTLNDNLRTPYNADDVPDSRKEEVLRLARMLVSAVEHREGQATSLIFEQPEAELACSIRAHAFPPQDPDGAPTPRIGIMQHDWNPDNFHEIRQVDEREGGRMHGHVDQTGTDGVVLLNLGGCDFFFDIGKGRGKGRCTAQKTKEQWCVGNGQGGHWITGADAPPERYHSIDPRAHKWLLKDRLCATCAAGGHGQQCASCAHGTVHLRSGDLVIFSGCGAFHGVSKVTTNKERELALPAGAPQLPAWAASHLEAGWRVSVQWRLTNREAALKKARQESQRVAESGVRFGVQSHGGVHPQLLGEKEMLQVALSASLAEGMHRRSTHSAPAAIPPPPSDAAAGAGGSNVDMGSLLGSGDSRESAISLDSDDEDADEDADEDTSPLAPASAKRRKAETSDAQPRLEPTGTAPQEAREAPVADHERARLARLKRFGGA